MVGGGGGESYDGGKGCVIRTIGGRGGGGDNGLNPQTTAGAQPHDMVTKLPHEDKKRIHPIIIIIIIIGGIYQKYIQF